MTEYIERNTAIKRIKEYALSVFGIDLDNSQEYAGRSLPENYCEGLYEATELIDDLPAADVAPVRHGRWIESPRLYYGAKQYECSLCYSDTFWNKHSITEKYPHCPNCGAKMYGDAE